MADTVVEAIYGGLFFVCLFFNRYWYMYCLSIFLKVWCCRAVVTGLLRAREGKWDTFERCCSRRRRHV